MPPTSISLADRKRWEDVKEQYTRRGRYYETGLCASLDEVWETPTQLARMQKQLCTYRPRKANRWGYWWPCDSDAGHRRRITVLNKLIKGELGPYQK